MAHVTRVPLLCHPQADDLLSGAPTEGIRKLMQAAATGPDGKTMGVNEDLILELDVRSCQVRDCSTDDLTSCKSFAFNGKLIADGRLVR